jgi:hypothetical protein
MNSWWRWCCMLRPMTVPARIDAPHSPFRWTKLPPWNDIAPLPTQAGGFEHRTVATPVMRAHSTLLRRERSFHFSPVLRLNSIAIVRANKTAVFPAARIDARSIWNSLMLFWRNYVIGIRRRIIISSSISCTRARLCTGVVGQILMALENSGRGRFCAGRYLDILTIRYLDILTILGDSS